MNDADIVFEARILRKRSDLPRYVVVPPDCLPGRKAAFAADVHLDEAGPFPRNIRPWGKGSDVFFFNLTEVQCRKAGLETGDVCRVTVRPRSSQSNASPGSTPQSARGSTQPR